MEEHLSRENQWPFEFRQCTTILKATGRKASNLKELRHIISIVSDDSIFHHTYQYFLKEHILEYTNDFAHWAGESLEERAVAEELSNIDPYGYATLAELRSALLSVIDSCLEIVSQDRPAPPGEEFYFNETITYVFPAGVWASNLAEFLMALKFVDDGSIYYHFYEARMRVPGGVDDFSQWIEQALHKKELAERIRAIDPFMHDTSEIRAYITDIVMKEVSRDMERMGVDI
ncbi:MAG: hypothetical protein H6Q52_2260 [Deltaproteobacteria bacterium]|nr:hypothetical protein [Deltaproteobacteria bacterium]